MDAPEAPPPAIAAHEIDELFAEDAPAAVEAPVPAAPAEAATAEEAAPAEAGVAEEVIGYCMRCRTKRPIKNAHEEISESGRRAARGTCPVCGTNMFVFLAAGGNEREAV
jgi:hypothetical protein